MAKGARSQNLPADVANLIDQLERHCLASDGSYMSKSAHSELQLAREDILRERTRYLEAVAVYAEAMAMVEEYHQAIASANHPSLYSYELSCSPEVYDSLEHRLVVAEAAQRLRLPLLSKDGEIHEQDIESSDTVDPGVGGLPNCFLGVTPCFLQQAQQEQPAANVNPLPLVRFQVLGFQKGARANPWCAY